MSFPPFHSFRNINPTGFWFLLAWHWWELTPFYYFIFSSRNMVGLFISKRVPEQCVCVSVYVCVCVCVCSCSVMSDSATIWTVTHQTRLSLERSRQEYWGGLPFATPGDFLTQGWSPSLRHRWHRQQTLYQWAIWEAPKPWTQNKDILWRKERIYY